MPKRALKLVFDWIDLHKAELNENWELAQQGEKLKNIEPLKYLLCLYCGLQKLNM